MPILKLPAKIENLDNFRQMIAGIAAENGFSDERIQEIVMAAEEALINIFNYAYPETAGSVTVDCRFEDPDRFFIEISDQGAPFDLLSVPEPDLSASVSARQVGGLGVFFIRKLMDEVQYRREGACNVLTFINKRR